MITKPFQIIALLSSLLSSCEAPKCLEGLSASVAKYFRARLPTEHSNNWLVTFAKISNGMSVVAVGVVIERDEQKLSIMSNERLMELERESDNVEAFIVATGSHVLMSANLDFRSVGPLAIISLKAPKTPKYAYVKPIGLPGTSEGVKNRPASGFTPMIRKSRGWKSVPAKVTTPDKCQEAAQASGKVLDMQNEYFCVTIEMEDGEARIFLGAPYYTQGENGDTMWGVYHSGLSNAGRIFYSVHQGSTRTHAAEKSEVHTSEVASSSGSKAW